jgi:KDO2-lipid IV(A) lauroyltransferase
MAWNRALSRGLLRGILAFLPRRRKLILSQMESSFPDQSASALKKMADRSIDCLGDGLATFTRIPRMSRREMDAMIHLSGFEHIEAAFQKKHGMITFTAHYGCWELMAIYVTKLYPRIAMLVRPLDNPLLNDLVAGVRRSGGGGVIDSRHVFTEGARLLRENGILGILVDQNFYKGGVFVDFFGRPAATSPLVPILARRTGCAVLPMHNFWRDNKLHIVCEPPVALSLQADRSLAIAEDTQRITAIVERWVRDDPTQWLWLHNRWKRQPTAEEAALIRQRGPLAAQI